MLVDAVIDASFWINLERSGFASHLQSYFTLHATPIVAQELTVLIERLDNPPSGAILFASWLRLGAVDIVAPMEKFDRFDVGEDQAIALAQERRWVLLIDDEEPWHFSRGPLKLRVVDSPAFAVFLYEQNRLSLTESMHVLRLSQASRRVVSEALINLERIARRRGDR